jgi:hypothetical protein
MTLAKHEIEFLVCLHLDIYALKLGLKAWDFKVEVEDDETIFTPHAGADTVVSTAYEQAFIRFCSTRIYHVEGLLQLLRHELIHAVVGDMNHYSITADKLARNKYELAAMQVVWTQSIERSVLSIERMLDAAGWTYDITEQEICWSLGFSQERTPL